MQLTFSSTALSVAFGCASFFMTDGDETIRVDIAQEVFAELGHRSPRTKSELVQLLAGHRRRFARIAAFKYGAGDYRQEVRVLVVQITLSDLELVD